MRNDDPVVELTAGDVLVLPRGSVHQIVSSPEAAFDGADLAVLGSVRGRVS